MCDRAGMDHVTEEIIDHWTKVQYLFSDYNGFGGGALFFLLNGMRTITSLTIENMQNQQVEEEAANYQAQSSY